MLYIKPLDRSSWGSLDYENRKWISIPQPVVDETGIDFSSFPDDVLYRGDGEGYLGFYSRAGQVYQLKELNGTWTPIEGVFRPIHGRHIGPFLNYGLVPKSFSVGC